MCSRGVDVSELPELHRPCAKRCTSINDGGGGGGRLGRIGTIGCGVLEGEGRGRCSSPRPKGDGGGTIAAVLTIRRYRPPERQAVWDLHNLALNAVGAHAGNGPWDDDLHRIPEVYLEAGGEFLVGLEGGRIVAMGALLRQEGTTCAVTRMRVHPDAQRRGHGRRILRRLEARAVRLGYERLVLETTERQVAAISLYRSEGYAETGRGVVHGFHCILYAKSLPGRA